MDDVVVVTLHFEDGTSSMLGVCSEMNFASDFVAKYKRETSSKRAFKVIYSLCPVHHPKKED